MPADPKPLPFAGVVAAQAGDASLPLVRDDVLDSVFERAPLGMVLFDADLQIVRANAAFAVLFGSRPDQLAGRSFWQGIHPQDRDRGREALRRVENRELDWITMQLRCLRDDGKDRWGEFATSVLWSPSNAFVSALSIVRDVTDSVAAESALRDSEMRNWRISESNMMGLFEWRDAVTISEANDAFLQMLGYTRDDLRAGVILWRDIVPPDYQELAARLRTELLTSGRVRPTRMDYRSRNGDRIPVLAGAARISWEPMARGMGFVLDMSEQRRIEDERASAEAALRQSLADLEQAQMRLQLADRMSSMATLAAGVAHEINNPLAFVVANLGFAQEEVNGLRAHPLTSEFDGRLTSLTRALGEAQEGANRVRNIVLDLRTFSRPYAELSGPVDIHRVLDSVISMARAELVGGARVVRRFQRVPPVLGNEARLSQLFLNLVVNAAQSLPANCDQANAADPDQVPSEIRLTVEETDGGCVQVEVSDTGLGIPPEHLGRIFDPFFTTRPIGRGTGLGLSICHEIVDSLGGRISVRSVPTKGTTFRVVLPAAAENAPAVVSAVPAPNVVPADSELNARILVVDDEPLMGSAIARVLATHEVTVLTSARTAMSRIAAGERFDLILCDVMMPDFSGIDLYDAVAKAAPDLLERMVFVTGGAYTPNAVDFLERVPNARLEKPILPQVLHSAVATMLQTLKTRSRSMPE